MALTVTSFLVLLAVIATPSFAQDYCSNLQKCNTVPSFPSTPMTGTVYTSLTVTNVDSTHINFNLNGNSCTDTIPLTLACSNNVVTTTAGSCTGNCGGSTCNQAGTFFSAGISTSFSMVLSVSANGQDLVGTTSGGNTTFAGCAKLSSHITVPRVALIAAGVAAGAAVVAMV